MSALTKRSRILTTEERWAWGGGLLMGALCLAYAVVAVGNILDGVPNAELVSRVAAGEVSWRPTHTRVVTWGAAVLILAWGLLYLVDRRLFGRRRPITRAAKVPSMAQYRDVRPLTRRAREKAAKMDGGPGAIFFLGYLARTRVPLWFGHEDTMSVFTGPRWNKSSSIANPAVVEHQGPVVATSNKPGLVTDTMRYRTGPVYIYDPQGLYHGPNEAPMYWDPLSYIYRAPTERMVERATTLAQRFLFASGGNSKTDPHWGNAAKDIMGALMLAAAIDTKPRTILDVYSWVMAPGNTEPVNILSRDGRFPLVAASLDEYAHHPDKMRGSEYGTAQTVLSFLSHDTVRPWVTPAPGRVPFYPDTMVEGTPTLYLLSKEGEASTGALTAALTIAVYEAAEAAADAAGGRLPVPMLMVLDEVANVCRWENLPSLYTHMGSRGILPIAIFQNHPQGKKMWGEEMMQELVSASSIFLAGGNVKGDGFHRAVAHMIEQYERTTVSESRGKHGLTTSVSRQAEDTLSVADIRRLPREYSLMFYPGIPCVILRHVPIWRRKHRYKKRTEATTMTAPVVHRTHPAGHDPAPRPASTWGRKLYVEEEA